MVKKGSREAEPFFTILASTDGHHAVEGYPRPPLLIFRHDNVVDDMPIGEILHGPAEVGAINPEHRGALADSGRQKEDLLIDHVALEAID